MLYTGLGSAASKMTVVYPAPQRESVSFCDGSQFTSIQRYLAELNVPDTFLYWTGLIKFPVYDHQVDSKEYNEEVMRKFKESYPQFLFAQEIKRIEPNVILGFGEAALNCLTGKEGIDNFRGSILPWLLDPKVKVVCTYHPFRIYKDLQFGALAKLDINRAWGLHTNPYPHRSKIQITRIDTLAALQSWWMNHYRPNSFLAFDCEWVLRHITCIGFSFDGKHACSVRLLGHKNQQEAAELWRFVASILADPTTKKINQTVGVDRDICKQWGMPVANISDDVMLLGHTLHPEFPKGLDFYQSIYTEEPYHKGDSGDPNPFSRGFGKHMDYNARDAAVAMQCFLAMAKELRERNLVNFYTKIPRKTFHAYVPINERGIRVDEQQRQKLENKYNDLVQSLQDRLEGKLGRKLNPDSVKQVGELVYDEFKYKVRRHQTPGGTWAYDTDKETLEEIYLNECLPEHKEILGLIIYGRKASTVRSYLRAAIGGTKSGLSIPRYNLHNGRLETTYRLEGTKSGRTSGSSAYRSQILAKCGSDTALGAVLYRDIPNPQLGLQSFDEIERGQSLQTLPKRGYALEAFEDIELGTDIPTIFIPSPGYTLVEGDGGAAEARVVAALANDFETLHLMATTDIHKLTASWCIETSIDLVTKIMRELYGKRPRHAGNYDMGAYRLMHMIHKALKICEQILARFHANVPKVRQIFHANVRAAIDKYGKLAAVQGRERIFYGRRTQSLYKEAYSFIPQATVSDHIKEVIFVLQEAFDYAQAAILAEKHDSILAEVRNDIVEQYCEVFQPAMERELDFRKLNYGMAQDIAIRIPCELATSQTNWSEMIVRAA